MPSVLVADTGYERLKSHVIEATGLAYYRERDDELARHLAQRMEALGVDACDAYLELLHAGQESELDALVARLTIGETYFFRHAEQFEALRTVVLPELLNRNQQERRLRIWSAGCATGAEPYSIAALLREQFGAQIAGWDIFLLGTDVNRQFLSRAIEGRFDEWAFREAGNKFRERYFRQSGRAWLISDELRKSVTFQYHNLVRHSFPSLLNQLFGFDLIVCRNVMIYFDSAATASVLARFHEALADDGWLMVGHAESGFSGLQRFHTMSLPGATLYQKQKQRQTSQANGAGAEFLAALSVNDFPKDGAAAEPGPPGMMPGGQPEDPSAVSPAAHSEAAFEQVRLLANRGEWRQAADECQRLIEAGGFDALTHFYYALVLEQLEGTEKAEQALRRAIYLDRKHVLAHYHLGLLQLKERRAIQAARSFENVIQLLAEREDDTQQLAEADGLTVAELKELARAHLEVLRS
jgi:chemotaxis protein methyltransferase CheR